MKTIHILSVLGVLAGFLNIHAAEKHDHKHLTTPKGGRVLEKTKPTAEFLIEKDRTVTIHFYDEQMKPAAATTQTVTVIADAKEGKVKLEFDRKGDSLVSRSRLPEGDGCNLIVQFRQTAEAKPQNFRFKLDLHACGECKRAEYACVCGH